MGGKAKPNIDEETLNHIPGMEHKANGWYFNGEKVKSVNGESPPPEPGVDEYQEYGEQYSDDEFPSDEMMIDPDLDYEPLPPELHTDPHGFNSPSADPHRRAVEQEFPGANIQKIKKMEAIKKMLPVKNMQEVINIDEVKNIEEIDDDVADQFIVDESLENEIIGSSEIIIEPPEPDIIDTVDGDEGGYGGEEEFHDEFLDNEGIPFKGDLDDPEAIDLVDGIEDEEEIVDLLEGKKETEEAKLDVLDAVQERHVAKRDHLIAKYHGLAAQIEERLNEDVEDIQASYNKLTFHILSHLSDICELQFFSLHSCCHYSHFKLKLHLNY